MYGSTFVFIFRVNLYLIWIISIFTRGEMSNFKIDDWLVCEEINDSKMFLFIHPKNLNLGLQLVDVNMSLPVPIGNDARAKVVFELDTHLANKHSWIHLFDLEDDFCKMLDKYLGQLWYDIEIGLGIMPRSCPIPRGVYHAVNLQLDYQHLRLQSLPVGKIRITAHVFLKARPEIRGCFKFIVSTSV